MCYPLWAVSYFLLEAKLLCWHDCPPLRDDEEESQRLHDRSKTGASQSWPSTQGGPTLTMSVTWGSWVA